MTNILITSLPMTVCAVLSVLLGLSLHDKWDKPRLKLLLFMTAATLLYIGHFVFFNRLVTVIPLTDTVYSFCNPAVYPLFFIYIEELTQHHPDRRRQMLYLLPAIMCSLGVGTLYALMDSRDTDTFIQHYLYGNKSVSVTALAQWQGVAHMVVKVVFALEIPPVLLMGWRHIKHYNWQVENYYSNTEGKTLEPINSLMVLFVLTSVVSFVCNIIGRYWFTSSHLLTVIPAATFSVLILLIAHIGLRQQFYVKDLPSDEDDTTERLAGPVAQMSGNKLTAGIIRLIEDEQLFLQPNLKTDDLAQRLNTNRNYIYNAINVEMGVSFSEFINKKRIGYAAGIIESEPGILLNDVATKSGFSSISAFYRNFKLYKGCSPSDYKQQVQVR